MFGLWLLVLGTAAPTAPTVASNCSGSASPNNMTVYGEAPARTIADLPSQAACCAQCSEAQGCLAWYWRPHDAKGVVGGHECLVFNVSQAGALHTGTCSTWEPPKSCAAALTQPLPGPTPPTPPSPAPPAPGQAVGVLVSTSTSTSTTISPYLSTFSLVYAWAPDAVYANGTTHTLPTLAAYARANRVATARWPAGQASYFNWENSTGQMGNSTLDPAWVGPAAPREDWMNLDEYLALCRAAGIARPLVGVNYNCHGKLWVSQHDSIARAVRQVRHVLAAGFAGAFYYVGNEDGAPRYAERIAAHARAMRAADPSCKIFWNDNGVNPASLTKFLAATGDALDGVEFHGKWPYGGTPPGKGAFSWAQYLEEVPLVEHKSGQTWRAKIAGLRAAAAAAGRPELLLANNEYGLGKPAVLSNFSRFGKGLVVAEFALEMYVGGYDMAAFWDNGDGCAATTGLGCDHADQMLMDSGEGYRMNPMALGMGLLARCTGSGMRAVETNCSRVHGFAARNDTTTGSGGDDLTAPLRLYLINKLEQDQLVTVSLPASGRAQSAYAYATPKQESMVDTEDHWGTIEIDGGGATCDAGGRSCSAVLPAASLTLLTFSPV